MPQNERATFSEVDECCDERGWATRGLGDGRWLPGLWCRVVGHRFPIRPVVSGYHPVDSDRCWRCGEAVNGYVVGQHHFGGYDRDVRRQMGWPVPPVETGDTDE